jgi:hypothetical protein
MSQFDEIKIQVNDNTKDAEFEKIREERQREVDRLSLELLSNSKHYKKMTAKNSVEDGIKKADNNRRILKYKSRVTAMFIELIDEYENTGEIATLVGTDLQYIFKECIQKMVQHLEWNEYNHNVDSAGFEEDEEDEDMMFSMASSHRNKRKTAPNKADPFSYWGTTIRKSESSDDPFL